MESSFCIDQILTSIKAGGNPRDNIKYCPTWIIGRKKGRPKKEERNLGITDHIAKSMKTNRRRHGSTNRKQGGKKKAMAPIFEDIFEDDLLVDIEQAKEDTKDGVTGSA